jgi:hypothetical protein
MSHVLLAAPRALQCQALPNSKRIAQYQNIPLSFIPSRLKSAGVCAEAGLVGVPGEPPGRGVDLDEKLVARYPDPHVCLPSNHRLGGTVTDC